MEIARSVLDLLYLGELIRMIRKRKVVMPRVYGEREGEERHREKPLLREFRPRIRSAGRDCAAWFLHSSTAPVLRGKSQTFDHGGATLIKLRVRRAGADARPVPPATAAFRMRCPADCRRRRCAFLDREIAENEELLDLLFRNRSNVLGIATKKDRSFERVAD